MPPRKAKVVVKEPCVVDETPVVFFLKVVDEEYDGINPAEETTTYSEILVSVENTTRERFNTDLMKTVLDKMTTDRYTPQTACFWCCHSFNWSPCILPKSYDAYKNIYTCEGNFCSPECALAYTYADHKLSDSAKWSQHALLGDVYSEMYKKRTLSPAPPRSTLRMFGGSLDIEQFRDYINGTNDIVLCDMPPVRLHFPSMNVQGPLRDIKKYVSLSTDVVEKATEQLRLKRSKPVNPNIQTLDMCISRA